LDVDPGAVAAARDNARRNGVAAEFFDSDALLDFTAGLVVANILANPLKLLAPVLARHCDAGGRLALSGILAPQAVEIRKAYNTWFALEECAEEGGWLCLSGARR
jgi:ribosomal protein L11 methyltransferase